MATRLVRFNASASFEGRLFEADIRSTRAHAAMLAQADLLTSDELTRIEGALDTILADWQAGRVQLLEEHEDMHMNLEVLLVERAGEAGKKVHTARSRNDQQAAAQRLYFKESTRALAEQVLTLERTILRHCQDHRGLVMPSYTHLQRAEITEYAHWLSTYVVMLDRDRSRLRDCLVRADESPLGACASTGTSLGIDRARTAAALGFARPTAHSIDSVSDRDYLMELTFVCSTLMVHLSRLAEEMILFTSQEFGFLELADAYCTGSSIMPQKKNPDVPELVRGKAATVIGEVVKLLALMKGLPLGYNKDAQEDKRAWFSALDAATESVAIMIDVVETMRPIPGRLREATGRGHLLATEYANYLVRKGLAFREAHHVVGALVREAEQRGVDLRELPLDALRQGSPLFGEDIAQITVDRAASSKNSTGAPGETALPALLDELSLLLTKG